MGLALDLLREGSKEVVLEFFVKCAAFWKHGNEELEAWTKDVEEGRVPDFGANLAY